MQYLAILGLLLVALNAHAGSCGTEKGHSYRFGAAYTADLLANVEGGVRRRAAYLDNLDLTLSVDGNSALEWQNTCLFVYGLYNNGAKFSDGIVGDAQYVSNIETDVRAARLYEAWIERRLPRARTSVKTGLYDLNSEFDHMDAADLFINSAQGIGTAFAQTGENGPSIFPETSLALRVKTGVGRHWRVRAAVLDAVPGDPRHPARTVIRLGQGTLGVLETVYASASHRVGAGYWQYSSRFADITSGAMHHGNEGWYAFGEMVPLSLPRVSMFLRIGQASARFNQFHTFVGAGLVLHGAITGSPGDALGFAVAWAQTGQPWRASTGGQANEVDLEFAWHIQLSQAFSVQPDLQYVINPSANPALGNALVAGVRGTLELSAP